MNHAWVKLQMDLNLGEPNYFSSGSDTFQRSYVCLFSRKNIFLTVDIPWNWDIESSWTRKVWHAFCTKKALLGELVS